ncbi:MAG: polyketide cyclase [Myxococcaceae bacterium]|nr:polyketide cyclase [Myxococcaceae bacterium]
MVRRFLFFGVLLLLALFVFLQSRSSTYRIERSVLVSAPQRAVYERLEDLHEWPRWSPWDALDPKLERTYTGPARGAGASFGWNGNAQVGRGSITIIDARPPAQLSYKVAFEAPLEAEMKYDFSVRPVGEGSKVTWVFNGQHPFWAKLFTLFVDLDKQLGGDMERGLLALKALVEKS